MQAEVMDWSPERYHADLSAVSHSQLDVFIEDPALYYGRCVSKVWPQEHRDHFEFGRVLHEVFLIGRELRDLVVEIPASALSKNGARAGNAWKDFAGECSAAGVTPMFAEDMATVNCLCGAIFRHPMAMRLFGLEGPTEVPIAWTDSRGIRRRSMLDKLATGYCIADLKGMANVSERKFKSAAYDYGYHRQAAYYREAVEALCGESLPFLFVAVKKSPPYTCEVIALDEAFVDLGQRENDAALDHLAECRETGVWLRRGYGEILTIEAPVWAKQRELAKV